MTLVIKSKFDSRVGRIIIFFCIFLTICSVLNATPPVVLEEGKNNYSIGLNLDLLEDIDRQWNLNDIMSLEISQKFTPSKDSVTNFGFTKSAIWLRFHLINNLPIHKELILEVAYPLVDHIEFYFPVSNGRYQMKKGGEEVLFQNLEIKYPNPLFNITIQPGEEQIIYIRYYDEGSVSFPLVLWDTKTFMEKSNRQQYVLGLYYGIILAMILYNLFLLLSTKDKAYFYYILYVASIAVFLMINNGLAQEYFWPNASSWWNNRSIIIFGYLAAFWILQFSKTFLHMKKNSPVLKKIFTVVMGVIVLEIGLTFFIDYTLQASMFVIIISVGFLMVLLAGVLCWRAGYSPARYFLLAFFTFIAGGILLSLRVLKILPSFFLTENSAQIGSAMEVILLSFALGDRINLMKFQKEKAQQETLKAQNETLRVQRGLNEELEIRVEDRTRQLNDKNRQITDSILYAQKIQESILPSIIDFHFFFPKSFIFWEPRDIVGGDFYQIYPLKDGFLLILADCTGHGVPGGFMTMLSSSTLRNIIIEEGITDPGMIMARLNQNIKTNLRQMGKESSNVSDDGLDGSICYIKPDENIIYFAGAKSSLYMMENNEVTEIKGDRCSVGLKRSEMDFKFSTHEIGISNNRSFYLLTDGFIDQIGGPKGFSYGKQKLQELIIENQGRSFDKQYVYFKNEFKTWQGDCDRLDDVTVIGFKIAD